MKNFSELTIIKHKIKLWPCGAKARRTMFYLGAHKKTGSANPEDAANLEAQSDPEALGTFRPEHLHQLEADEVPSVK